MSPTASDVEDQCAEYVIHGDYHNLTRAVRDLVCNSLNHVDVGRSVTVTVRRLVPPGQTRPHLRVDVTDNGSGVSPVRKKGSEMGEGWALTLARGGGLCRCP